MRKNDGNDNLIAFQNSANMIFLSGMAICFKFAFFGGEKDSFKYGLYYKSRKIVRIVGMRVLYGFIRFYSFLNTLHLNAKLHNNRCFCNKHIKYSLM